MIPAALLDEVPENYVDKSFAGGGMRQSKQ